MRKTIYNKLFLKVFNNIDEYAPGFSSSVIGYEVLSPPDLEKTFGLTGGVINCLLISH
jgi:phytoene dehydrogenase-like protein